MPRQHNAEELALMAQRGLETDYANLKDILEAEAEAST
jgi:hypothetical protein